MLIKKIMQEIEFDGNLTLSKYLNQKMTFDALWLTSNLLKKYVDYNKNDHISKKEFLKYSLTFLKKHWEIFFNQKNPEIKSINDKKQMLIQSLNILDATSTLEIDDNIFIKNKKIFKLLTSDNGFNESLTFTIEYYKEIMKRLNMKNIIDENIKIFSENNKNNSKYSKFERNNKQILNNKFLQIIQNKFKNNVSSLKNATRIFNKPCIYLCFASNKFIDINKEKLAYMKNVVIHNDSILDLFENVKTIDIDLENIDIEKYRYNHEIDAKKIMEIINNPNDFLQNKNISKEKIKKIIRKNFRKIISGKSDVVIDGVENFDNSFLEAAHYYSVSKIANDCEKINDKNVIKEILSLVRSQKNGFYIPYTFHKLYDNSYLEIDFEKEKFVINKKYNIFRKQIEIVGFSENNKISPQKIKEIFLFKSKYEKLIGKPIFNKNK